jgi:LAS superfamily LD-carboxypeptidase LdcB
MPEVFLPKKSKKSGKKLLHRFVLFLLIVGAMFGVYILLKKDTEKTPVLTSSESNNQVQAQSNTLTDNLSSERQLKLFSGTEFVSFYDSFAYPNVREFEIAPPITGNSSVDERIRSVALSRGYKGRSVAIPPLVDVGSYQLQDRAASAWNELVTAAKKEHQILTLNAGFRTIEDQRDLFVDALNSTGATASSILAGKSDAAIDKVLQRTSIPGYTKHHSGYAVDIACESDKNKIFETSACFKWLSKNNYENAKKYGWIPSYPEGAPNQGPDPESWEYCWVGYEAISEPVN